METLNKTAIKKLVEGVPAEGFAEIRLLNPKKTGTIVIRDYLIDGKKRLYVDQHGAERVLKVQKKILLNLSDLNDRLTYEQVRLHPIYVKGANPVLKLINHEVEDNNFVLAKDLEAKANGIIQKLSDDEVKSFARVLLVTIKERSSPTAIKRKLYDKVQEDPQNVINEWENEDRELKIMIRAGIEKGLFTKSNGVFKFKEQTIGTTFELALEWLRENDDLHPSIRKELK